MRAAQRWEQERAAHKKEKGNRRRERRDQRSDECRLREQLGLSSPTTSEYSSSGDEEEESDGGRASPERWEPSPPSPTAVEAAEETAPGRVRERRHQATYERGDARRGGAGTCH
jgi:hypothetical protein